MSRGYQAKIERNNVLNTGSSLYKSLVPLTDWGNTWFERRAASDESVESDRIQVMNLITEES